MGIFGSKYCEIHKDQEMMFICLTENPPQPLCAKCRFEKQHAGHEVRSTKNFADELIEKATTQVQKVKRKFKLTMDQPKSLKSFEKILEQGVGVIKGIFDKIRGELDEIQRESIDNFTAHMKQQFEEMEVGEHHTEMLPSFQKLIAEIDEDVKKLKDLFDQGQFIEVCRANESFMKMKKQLKDFMLSVQNDFSIRQKLEAYQIFFEQGEFRNQLRKTIQNHMKYYYSGDKGKDEITSVRVNRLHLFLQNERKLKLYDIHSSHSNTLSLKGAETLADIGCQSLEAADTFYICGGRKGTKYLKDHYMFIEESGFNYEIY